MLPSKLLCPAFLAVYSKILTYCPNCPQFVLSSQFLCPTLQDSSWASPRVTVDRTTITGTVLQPSNVEFFGGIPFAKPPIGDLRLKPAVFLPTPGVPTLNATNYGHICLQTPPKDYTTSEDCLTLNVYRPAGVPRNAKLPVMFWIFGGGYVVGHSQENQGTDIVAYSAKRGTPVIIVDFNYRVGPLGFPQGVEAGRRKALNLGFGDQIAALKWVNRNIGNFGGDKSKVTIFGESAGAASTVIHLYGTEIGKYARGVILESFSTLPTYNHDRHEAAWQNYVAAVPSCAHVANTTNTFDCILKADSAALFQGLVNAKITAGQTTFKPVVDGPGGFLPKRPSQMTYKTYLPAIVGSNLDEGTMFSSPTVDSDDRIRELLTKFTSPQLDPKKFALGLERILQLYPDKPALGSPFRTGNNTFGLSSHYKRYAALYGDLVFQSPRRSFTQKMSKAGVPVYGYLFVDGGGYGPPETTPLPPSQGIFHGIELAYVFNTFLEAPKPTPDAALLGRIVQDYWISFATNLNPNDYRGTRRPLWVPHTFFNRNIMELEGVKSYMRHDQFRLQQIAFFQNNPDLFHQ